MRAHVSNWLHVAAVDSGALWWDGMSKRLLI